MRIQRRKTEEQRHVRPRSSDLGSSRARSGEKGNTNRENGKERTIMVVNAMDVTGMARSLGFAPLEGTVAASLAVLYVLPGNVAAILLAAFTSPQRELQRGVRLATNKEGRQWVLTESAEKDGAPRLAILSELEWRLSGGDVTLEIYALDPRQVQ